MGVGVASLSNGKGFTALLDSPCSGEKHLPLDEDSAAQKDVPTRSHLATAEKSMMRIDLEVCGCLKIGE